jgi:uncharacterized phage-associated protein
MRAWFNVRKAAQVAAYFTIQSGGEINVPRLAKLVYLANRLAMQKIDFPLLNDNLVSMDHGPVNYLTYDYIIGSQEHSSWDEFLTARARHIIGLANRNLSIDDLDELSASDIDLLGETWKNFGQMNQWQLRDHCYYNCPEWERPEGSSTPIPHERVFKFLSKGAESEFLAKRIIEQRHIDEVFAGSR